MRGVPHKFFKLPVRGTIYTVRFRSVASRLRGRADFGPKILWILPGESAETTLIHEVLHAALPDLDESSVLETEAALYLALQKFRRLKL